MNEATRRTLRNGAIGGVVGAALGFVPLVLLVAPLLGGGLAGYLQREGPRRGALAGATAGVLMAALGTAITGVLVFVRFGDLPGAGVVSTLGIAALLSLAATVGQIVVASLGGALGALLVTDRAPVGGGPSLADARPRRWGPIVGGLAAGAVTFVVVAAALTAALDPLIWPSLLVGLPVGAVAGAGAAVLGYRYLARGPESAVDWRAVGVGVLALAVVFALVVGGVSLLGQQQIDRNLQSTYEYRVTISADRTLENATFYVPVPQTGGESRLGERFVEDVQYQRDVPAIQGYDPDPAPVNFTYDLVETEHGRMLAISADRVEVSRVYYREVQNETMGWRERVDPGAYDPSDPSMGVRTDGSFTFTVTAVADDQIETADPFGTEPLLAPRYDRTEVECAFGQSATHHCYEYDTRTYASYDAAANTSVYVATDLTGRNEWFSGGWTGNEYRQRSAVELRGPGTGWYLTRGELEVGDGRYRD